MITKYLRGLCRSALAACLLLPLLSVGCTNLYDIKSDLADQGYVMSMPAQGAIEPGQIWFYDGRRAVCVLPKPSIVHITSTPASIESLTGYVNANLATDLAFARNLLAPADAFAASLNAASVSSVEIEPGPTYVDSISPAVLFSPAFQPKLSSDYQQALENVRNATPGWSLITRAIRSHGITYTFTCSDPKRFRAELPTLQRLTSARSSVSFESDAVVHYVVPSSTPMVLGFCPVSGDALLQPSAVSVALRQNTSQLYALDSLTRHAKPLADNQLKQLVPRPAIVANKQLKSPPNRTTPVLAEISPPPAPPAQPDAASTPDPMLDDQLMLLDTRIAGIEAMLKRRPDSESQSSETKFLKSVLADLNSESSALKKMRLPTPPATRPTASADSDPHPMRLGDIQRTWPAHAPRR